VITGRDPERARPLIEGLGAQGLDCTAFAVAGEPTTETVTAGADFARQAGAEVVIALGGGSAIDAGKAIAALLANPGDLFDYLEVIGQGRAIAAAPAPLIAIPTTAGTRAEVTRNAVIISPRHRVKVSMRSPLMLPRLAVVDPELTYSLPRSVTAATGLDALTQLLESFVTHRANPLTDGLCREGLARAARSLRTACETGDHAAREDMAIASLFSGLALANAGLGAVHGLAAPLGGLLEAPHGMVCARLLPIVMRANVRAITERAAEHPARARLAEIARLVTGNANAQVDDGVRWIEDLGRTLDVPGLARFGLKAADIPTVVRQAQQASSMKGNPIALTDAELTGVLEEAL